MSHLREVPRFTPADGFILAVDPATKSGWAMTKGSVRLGSGVCSTAGLRRNLVEEWVQVGPELPHVAVMEIWGPHWKSHQAMLAVAAARGRWLQLFEEHGVPVVDVRPEVWRQRLYGKGYSNLAKTTSAQYKSIAVTHAKSRYGIDVGPDEAEALMIATWGMYSHEVAEAMYPPTKKRVGV